MTNLDRAITRRADMIRAVLYCRVSTKEQTLNLSLSTQLEACREYCTREGFDVAAEFIEQGESAKTADRTELQRLLAYCRQHRSQVQYLIVYNLSRFARDRHDHVLLRVLLQRLGVTLRSVTEPIDDSSTGKLMEGVLASFAQFDNDVRADRTKAGMQKALRSGRWPFQAPLGYRNARGSGSSLIPDLELASVAPRDPLYREAIALRAHWRIVRGAAGDGATALALLDPILAAGADAEAWLLRARAGVVANRPAAAHWALFEVQRRLRRAPDRRQLARGALRVLSAIPSGAEESGLRSAFEAAAR